MHIALRKRRRKRKDAAGKTVIQSRFVLDFIDPVRRRRKQLFFKTIGEAAQAQERLKQHAVDHQPYALTVQKAFDHWLCDRNGNVKPTTLRGYQQFRTYVVGPLYVGNPSERRKARQGSMKGIEQVPMLGHLKFSELTTARIRAWHRELSALVSPHTARHAKTLLRAAMHLAAEDFGLRIPAMPTRLGKGQQRPKKAILSLEHVLKLQDASASNIAATYVLFPFLTGVRPSEQLALAWSDIDFIHRRVSVSRMQELSGEITHFTKTAAGTRVVPLCELAHACLLRLREIDNPLTEEAQVFCARGSGNVRHRFGQRLRYDNFRKSYWKPTLAKLELPDVTPHSARHWFISSLQSRQVEVGLVAKLAGHADASVTLDHYTQAFRGGSEAIAKLDEMMRRE